LVHYAFATEEVNTAFPADITRAMNRHSQKLEIFMTGISVSVSATIPAFTIKLNSPSVRIVIGKDIICRMGRINRFASQRTEPAATMAANPPENLTPFGKRIEASANAPTQTIHFIKIFIPASAFRFI